MRLVSLSLTGYRQFLERTEIQIPVGLTGICGTNGVGKSKLIEAIGYALFGANRRLLPASDKESDLASVSGDRNIATEVCLELEVRGQHYRIRRTRKARECCIELLTREGTSPSVATPLATSPSEVTKKVIELFGITPEAYLRTFVARQKEVAGIQSIKSPGDRQKLINRLIGIAQIEKALSFAEVERKHRASTLEAKILDEGDAANVSLADANLLALRNALTDATERENECVVRLDEARHATKDGRQKKVKLNEKFTEVQAKHKEISTLTSAAIDLELDVKEATQRFEECLSAQRQIELAEKVLEESQEVPDEVIRHVTLKDLASARQQKEDAIQRLETVRANLEIHRSCEQKLHQINRRVELLQAESAKHQEAQKTAQAAKKEAERQAIVLRERLRNVQTMGAAGICERCGQRLGQNLDVVLSGLTADLETAEAQFETAATEEQNVVRALQFAMEAVKAAEHERSNLQKQFESGANLPGQFEAAQNHYLEYQQALLAYPTELLLLPYDVTAYREAEEKMQQRTYAEGMRSTYEQTAANRQSAEDTLARATRQLGQNKERREILSTELATLTDVENAMREAGEHLTELEDSEVAATAQWQAATSARAQAEAALIPAEEKVQQAKRRAERIAALRHDLEIAERTEALLRATRDEITGESCPRLSEMMDGWARSLMGSHFHTVQLTTDYRIEADNGSGMHTIEHFSGGEQTLLAVMLRVAISLYCQERLGIGAGFLVLDEVFGDQDDLHRAQLVQFLDEIKPHYHQVLIVNHVPDVTDRLGSIIEVTATGEKTSKAVLRL